MDVLRAVGSPVSRVSEGAARLQRRISAIVECEPLPRWVAVGFVVFAVTALLSDVAGSGLSWPLTITGVPVVVELILSYGALAAFGFRPLHGVLLSWVALGFALSTGSLGLPLLIAAVACVVVAARCGRALVVVHAAVCLAYGALASLGRNSVTDDLRVFWTVLSVVVFGLVAGVGVRLAATRLAVQNAKVRELEQLNARIRQEERSALARELHDVVAHELTVITMQVMGRRASRDPDELQEVLSVVDASARSALTELRKMLVLLRDEGLVAASPDYSRDPDLERILEGLAEELISLGYPTTWTYDEDGPEKLSATLLRTCSRILQEAVTNIIKHARKGSPCRLAAEVSSGWVHLHVVNQLTVGAPRRNEAGSSSLGLVGLGERVDLLRGNIRAGVRGGLWVVEVDIPINP